MAAGLYREIDVTRLGEAPCYDVEGARHGALRNDTVRDTARNTLPATWRAAHCLRHGALERVWALQHGWARPATRPGQACDKVQCARSVHAGWAKGGCTVHSTQF